MSIAVQGQLTYKAVAAQVCTCIEKKQEERPNAKKSLLLEYCYMDKLVKATDELKKTYHLNLNDEAQNQEVGRQIASYIVEICPTTSLFLSAEESVFSQTNKIEGRLSKIIDNGFRAIEVLDNTGAKHKLILLDYFEGAEDKLRALLSSENENKMFEFTWEEVKIYNRSTDQFEMVKQLIDIIEL